jgi:IS605 OrfB family transposase
VSPTDVVVVGNIDEKAKESMEEDANSKLRHRIHQWSVKKLIELLDEKPIHVVKVSERGTSSRDPFTGRRVRGFEPLVIRTAVKGLKRVKVMRVVLRIAKVGGRVLERRLRGSEHRVEVPKHRWGPRGVGLDGGP